MTWQIDFSDESLKFIEKEHFNESEIIDDLFKVVRKFKGEKVNIDLKKLKGEWLGFYRLRIGKKRIIFKINFKEHVILVDRIDFRGGIY